MRKIFTIFLTAALTGTLFCGCIQASATQEVQEVVKREAEAKSPEATQIKNTATVVSIAYVEETTSEEVETAPEIHYTEEVNGFSNEVDYLSVMKTCCLNGNHKAGKAAEVARNKKIDTLELSMEKVSFENLLELSKLITAECGSSWLSMEWKMSVGEVVINRKNSPEFPNTIYDVIHAQGQYSSANTNYFKTLIPFEDCVDAAARLLSGERVLNEPSVVFQSSCKQGSGVFCSLYDSVYGYTYLCYSNYPELYGG